MPAIFSTNSVTSRRLDPWHYQPDFQKVCAAIKSTGGHSELNCFIGHERGMTGGATPLGAEYQLNGVIRFYRTSEIKNMAILHDEAVFITAEDDDALARSRLGVGDVLLTITGAHFGESAVVESYHIPGNISQHSVRIGLADLNPYFLVAYLNCRHGQSMIWQQAYGATRPAIDYSSIRELLVLVPGKRAQKYIGEKVAKAERMRISARTRERQFEEIIALQFPDAFGEPKALGRSNFVSAKKLGRNLNPGAFNPERLRIREAIRTGGGRELGEVAAIEAATTDTFSLNDEYVGLDSISSTTLQLSPVKAASAEISGTARVLRVGPVISKLRPYLNKVAYIPPDLDGAVGSTELLCVRPNPGINGFFIYGLLKLKSTVRQFQPIANGSTHPRIVAEDVLETMVPWHKDADRLGRRLEQAQGMYLSAERLTIAAKLLVEILIEGRANEFDFAAAQDALERGDTSLDRTLLSRLTRQGIDAPGQPPLFPDLDALYALLEEVKTDNSNTESA